MLLEKDLILEKNDNIAETFSNFFTSVVSNSNILRLRYQDHFTDSEKTDNRIWHAILRIIEQYNPPPPPLPTRIVAINNQNIDRRFLF